MSVRVLFVSVRVVVRLGRIALASMMSGSV
jgi:hypothetical protein